MKKIAFLLLVAISSLQAQESTYNLTLKFADSLNLAINFYNISYKDRTRIKNIQSEYSKIRKTKNFTIPKNLKEELKNSKMYPLFYLDETLNIYKKININNQSKNCSIPSLHNIFIVDSCLSEKECLLFASKLSSEPNLELNCRLNEIYNLVGNPIPPSNQGSNDYRTIMNIDSLNAMGIIGTGSKIILVEKSLPILSHDEFKGRTDILNENTIVRLGNKNVSPIHSTLTAGILFSNLDENSKGVSTGAKLKNQICFGDSDCYTKTNNGRKLYINYLNSLLAAANRTNEGDIVLIEFGLNSGKYPIEFDILAKPIVEITINCFKGIVVEPIGNCNNEVCEIEKIALTSIQSDKGLKKPENYLGILVGATYGPKNGISNHQDVNFSHKHQTCFGIGVELLTTYSQNQYSSHSLSSGASAIIAGLVACMQGYYFKNKNKYLTHAQIKEALRNADGLHVEGFEQKIPNAMELIRYVNGNF